jgi:hypothetical protein
MLRAIALAFSFALIVGACKVNGEHVVTAPELILRAYDVPAAHAQELRNIVSSLMWKGENQPRGGNVVVAPTGQLLVSAPASFHEGVAQLAADIKKSPPPAPEAIAIEYWIVQGLPAETASVADDVPSEAREALVTLGGKVALTVWDHARLVSVANERAQVERRGVKIEQTTAQQGNTIVADLRIDTALGQLAVRTAMPAGKTTILAQAGNAEATSPASNGTVFYVVRAALAP